jgi:hypothetical protein
MSYLHRDKDPRFCKKILEDSGRHLWGIYPRYPHGYTWAVPSEVTQPARSRRAPQGYKVY